MEDMRELSRTKWTTPLTNFEAINTGSLLRIADATEKMAESYDSMRADRDFYVRLYESSQAHLKVSQRSASALRGIITKLKKGKAA